MNTIIKNAFSDIPKTDQSIALANELDAEYDKLFNDFIASGDKKRVATKKANEHFKNIDNRLTDVKPSQEFLDEVNTYSKSLKARGILGNFIIILGTFCMFAFLFAVEDELLTMDDIIIVYIAISALIIFGNIINAILYFPATKKIPSEINAYLVQKLTNFDNNKKPNIGKELFMHWFIISVSVVVLSLIFSKYFILMECVYAINSNPSNKLSPKKKK